MALSSTVPPSPDGVLSSLRELVSATQQTPNATIHIRATALLAQLKALNRAANTATRSRKQATAEARQEMDQTHLGLQNLLYEKRHLEREIDKCRQFASVYQDIPLHSVEEFKSLAPEELCTPTILGDEHKLMLNRLNFEYKERQRLEQRRKELTADKEKLLRTSKANQDTVERMQTLLDAVVKSAQEAQKIASELALSSLGAAAAV